MHVSSILTNSHKKIVSILVEMVQATQHLNTFMRTGQQMRHPSSEELIHGYFIPCLCTLSERPVKGSSSTHV